MSNAEYQPYKKTLFYVDSSYHYKSIIGVFIADALKLQIEMWDKHIYTLYSVIVSPNLYMLPSIPIVIKIASVT